MKSQKMSCVHVLLIVCVRTYPNVLNTYCVPMMTIMCFPPRCISTTPWHMHLHHTTATRALTLYFPLNRRRLWLYNILRCLLQRTRIGLSVCQPVCRRHRRTHIKTFYFFHSSFHYYSLYTLLVLLLLVIIHLSLCLCLPACLPA